MVFRHGDRVKVKDSHWNHSKFFKAYGANAFEVNRVVPTKSGLYCVLKPLHPRHDGYLGAMRTTIERL